MLHWLSAPGLILISLVAESSCQKKADPQLSLTQIRSCEAVEGTKDLDVSGEKLEFYNLNRELIAEGGSGEIEKWVFVNHSSPKTCDELLGRALYTVSYPTCCDVKPSQLLDCQTNRDVMISFEPRENEPIDSQYLNVIDRVSYIIGVDKPFTGTAVRFARYHQDPLKKTTTEQDYKDGMRTGTYRRKDKLGRILQAGSRDQDKEVTTRFDSEGRMVKEETDFTRNWQNNWKRDSRSYSKTWDVEGNLSCIYKRTQETCGFTQDGGVVP